MSTTGSTASGSGTQSNPTTLINAIDSATAGDIIRMATGTYNIDNALNLKDSITIEGGFESANAWRKTSLAGATTIHRTTANPEGVANARRIVAIYGNGLSGFRLQDLTISTDNGNQNGMSTYGVHLSSCSNYSIVRCQINPGDASDGANGNNGAAGANGNNGTAGTRGDDDNDTYLRRGGTGGNGCGGASGGTVASSTARVTGFTGGTGATSTSYFNGGAGGAGGNGGSEDRDGGRGGYGGGVPGTTGITAIGLNTTAGSCTGHKNTGNWWGDETGCNGAVVKTSGESGRCGSDGRNGTNGAVGALGTASTHTGGFFVPGGQGGSGTQGQGGQGGAGGGGGAGEGGFFCTDGVGGSGGGGGGGGCGGNGGSGGRGGGASFGIYGVSSNIGTISQCQITAGAAGLGGSGGAGGAGGNGGTGGNGGLGQSGDVGFGGDGGDGGNGGNGGSGGSGRSGLSVNNYGSLPSYTLFNLTSQPTITASWNDCTDSLITYTASAADTWTFSNAVPTTASSSTSASTRYSSTGRFDVRYGTHDYEGFTAIIAERPSTPNAGSDIYVCDTFAQLNATIPSIGTGYWTAAGTGDIADSTANNSNVSALTQGTQPFVWNVTSECCGTFTDTVNIIVELAPTTGISLVSQSSSCGDTAVLQSNPASSNGNVFSWTFTNAVPGSISGADSTGPFTVVYTSTGVQPVYLNVSYNNANCTYLDTLDVNVTCILPVKLIYFKVTKGNEFLELNWSTASEYHNSHFEIWTNNNGNRQKLATQPTKATNGNSSQTIAYKLLLPNSILKDGITTFELVQVDINGSKSLLSTEHILMESARNIFVRPNPFQDFIQIEGKGISQVEVYDSKGNLFYSNSLNAGQINTANWSPGLYLVKVWSNSTPTVHKVIKQQ